MVTWRYKMSLLELKILFNTRREMSYLRAAMLYPFKILFFENPTNLKH